MPVPQAESLIVKRPKAAAAPGVANKSPQPPDSPENGKQFAASDGQQAGNSRPDVVADGRVSCHEAAAAERDELVTRAIRRPSGAARRSTSAARGQLLGGSGKVGQIRRELTPWPITRQFPTSTAN